MALYDHCVLLVILIIRLKESKFYTFNHLSKAPILLASGPWILFEKYCEIDILNVSVFLPVQVQLA